MNVDLATQLATGIGIYPRPALPDIGVQALVPERWGGTWLSRHQISTWPSRYFNAVWHDPPYEWREWQRPLTHREPTLPPADSFAAYNPEPWLPRFYRPRVLDRATEEARLSRSMRSSARANCGCHTFGVFEHPNRTNWNSAEEQRAFCTLKAFKMRAVQGAAGA